MKNWEAWEIGNSKNQSKLTFELSQNSLKHRNHNMHVLQVLLRDQSEMLVVVNGQHSLKSQSGQVSVVDCDLIDGPVSEVHSVFHVGVSLVGSGFFRVGAVSSSVSRFSAFKAAAFFRLVLSAV